MIDFFDPDRTHDSLFAQKIKGQILSILKTAIGDRGIFDDPFPIVFVDRITPGGLTPWADNWSGLMFEFLKKLSRTHILDDGNLNGSAYGFEPPYQADLPAQIDLSTYKTNTITVRVPAGTKNGVLTWIERNHDSISAPYCANFANPIATTTRRSRLFNNPDSTPKTFTLSTKNWLHNSVCFAGIELQGLTDNQAQFLLYDRIQSFLDYLWGELSISDECKVLTGMTATTRRLFKYGGFTFNTNPRTLGNFYGLSPTIEFSNPLYGVTEAHYSYFQRGDIKNGALSVCKNGDSLWVEINKVIDFFEAWESTLSEPSPFGYELNADPFSNKFYTVLSYDNQTPLQETIKVSHKNNQNLSQQWIRSEFYYSLYTSYPPLSKKQRGNSTSSIFKLKAKPPGADFYFTEENAYGGQAQQTSSNVEPGEWDYGLFSPGEYIGFKAWNSRYYYGLTYVATGLLANDDLNIFSRGETALLQPDVRHFHEDYIEEVQGYGDYPEADHYILPGYRSYKRATATPRSEVIKIQIQQEDPLNSPNLLDSRNITTGTSEVFNGFTYEYLGNQYGDVIPFGGDLLLEPRILTHEILVAAQTTISREIREPNTIEYPTLVVFDPTNPNPSSRITIYLGEPGEAELQSILYPAGPDGPPLLDPDTDQGDVMPDSLRIKDIHAALDAGRFANHPQSTEEEPRVNLRTLGRLIEATSYVLGINFNEDGMNIPYPEPRLFDPEKIEEVNDRKLLKNSQFAVAQMGNGLDTSSLYEVRSALMKRDGSETVLDLRPHAIKYHNLPQLLDALSDDVSRHLGGASSAAFQVPAADGWRAQNYAGITQAIADLLYMSSVHSKSINELQNQSIKSVWMLQQVLKALGLPLHITKLEGVSGIKDPVEEGDLLRAYMPVPELDAKAPTLTSLLGVVLLNLQRLVGASVSFREENPEA
jgi:hypothetical protein